MAAVVTPPRSGGPLSPPVAARRTGLSRLIRRATARRPSPLGAGKRIQSRPERDRLAVFPGAAVPMEGAVQQLAALIAEVEVARQRVVAAVHGLTPDQEVFRPAPEEWSAAQVVEHLVLAEQAGINRIWQAATGARRGWPVWSGDPVHRGLSIEEVIARTWPAKADAPPWVVPKTGGPLAYWVACLQACQPVLGALGEALRGLDLAEVIFPHPISGPLDGRQRLEFLRWHLDHHRRQIEAIKSASDFPR